MKSWPLNLSCFPGGSDPDTGKWLRPKDGEGGGSQEMDGDRGLLGLGEGVPRQRHPSHSALALDPEAAAAAEARAPVPGILARILALMWLN